MAETFSQELQFGRHLEGVGTESQNNQKRRIIQINPSGGGGGGGGGSISPFGMIPIDHFRSLADVPFTDLFQGEDFAYISTTYGLTRLPDANRDPNGWPISTPGDSTVANRIYYTIRWPVVNCLVDFTWTGGALTGLSTTGGPDFAISNITANSALFTFTKNVAQYPGDPTKFYPNPNLQFDINPGNPPKNFQMIPQGRSGLYTPEMGTALDTYMGSGAIRPIKWLNAVEGGWVVTNRNTPSSAIWWSSRDGVPFEHIITLVTNRNKPLHWNIGIREDDATITAKAVLFKAWLLGGASRIGYLESGNENWNPFYATNTITLTKLAAINGTNNSTIGATITSITAGGGGNQTATVTTATPHGRATNDYISTWDCLAANPQYGNKFPDAYNRSGPVQITVTGANTFTYQMFADPGGPAATIGGWCFYNGNDISQFYSGILKEHGRRSSYVMDLIEATVGSSLMRAQVVRVLGGQCASPSNNDVTMGYSTTAAKHDTLAVACYFGDSVTYPADGMSRGSPAPYGPADFNSILADAKVDTNAQIELIRQNIVNATARGLKIGGYEFGNSRKLQGNAVAITSITRGGGGNLTATVVTAANHNLVNNYNVIMSGQTPAGFATGGLEVPVTVVNPTTFTYQMPADPGGNASVMGTYVNNGVMRAWGYSTQSRALMIYGMQEWVRITIGSNPAIVPYCNANWFVECGSLTFENNYGRPIFEYLGAGPTAKGQALIDYNSNAAGVSRIPNDLSGTTISAHAGDPNGTVVGSLSVGLVRDATLAIQSGGAGLGLSAATVAAPSVNIVVTNGASIIGGVPTSITIRTAHPGFPAPGYLDSTINYTPGAGLNTDNFNDNSKGANWGADGVAMISYGPMSAAGMTVNEQNQRLEFAYGAGATGGNHGVCRPGSATVDMSDGHIEFFKIIQLSAHDDGFCAGTPNNDIILLSRNATGFVLYHNNATTGPVSYQNLGGNGSASLASYPWIGWRKNGANLEILGYGGANNPPLVADWTVLLTITWLSYLNGAIFIGPATSQNFGATNGDTYITDGWNTGL